MSKQKQNGNKAKTAARAAEEKRLRTLRIVLVAVLAAAVVIGGAFGIRALVRHHAGPQDPTVPDGTTVNLDNADLSFVEYQGMQMPAVYAGILQEGDAQRAALCKKDGVVMKIGTREISRTEYEMYYYDQYLNAKRDAENTIAAYGQNRSGFDPEKLPGKQYYRGSTTWETRFIEKATEKIRHEAGCLEMAKLAGTKMNDHGISYLQERISTVQMQAEAKNSTEDAVIKESYGGAEVSAKLYYSRLVMNAMISAYLTTWTDDYAAALTQADLQAAFDADPRSYQTIDARVYLIENQEGLDAAAQVHTEQELLAFAKKYHPNKTVDIETFTDQRMSSYSSLSATFGDAVANWLFDDSRVLGVCGLIEDGMFNYLAVPLSKPYLTSSVDAELFPADFDASDEASVERAKENAETFRAQVAAAGYTAEAFEAQAKEFGSSDVRGTVSVSDFDEYGPALFLFDPARKPGDLTVIKQTNYYLVIMFLQKNPDDFDWVDEVKNKLVNEALEQSEATYLEKNAGAVNDKLVQTAATAVNDRLADTLKAG